jgi:hypothetical protein
LTWAIVLVALIIRGIYRLLTGAAAKEREEERRRQEQLQREEEQRRHDEQLRRNAEQAAQKEFEQAVMAGRFPSEEVLTVLQHGSTYMPVNLKEAVEELVFGRCSMSNMDWGDAVALIRQRKRIGDRAKARAARGEEPTGPLSQAEAYGLLGVSQGCSPEELASAYHRKVLEWHPDRLNEAMAQELREYATRRTQRINEAFQLLRQRA